MNRRKRKVAVKRLSRLGLVAATALVLLATIGTASASATQFRAEEYSSGINGSQTNEQVFGITSPIKCQTATFSGTESGASSALTLAPTYKQCKYNFGVSLNFSPNSCKYVFHSTNESAPFSGSVDIACSKEGDAIEAKAVNDCVVKFPAQSGLGSVAFANTGTRSRKRTITGTLNVTGLKYTETGTECPKSGSHEGGTITGSFLLKGYNEAAEHGIGIYLASEQVTSLPLFEGEQSPLYVRGQLLSYTATLGMTGWSTSCPIMSGTTKFSAASSELSPKIEHLEKCSDVGTVATNGCAFILKASVSEGLGASGTFGGIRCPAGKEITLHIHGICEIKIPAQGAPSQSDVGYLNTGTGSSRGIETSIEANLV